MPFNMDDYPLLDFYSQFKSQYDAQCNPIYLLAILTANQKTTVLIINQFVALYDFP